MKTRDSSVGTTTLRSLSCIHKNLIPLSLSLSPSFLSLSLSIIIFLITRKANVHSGRSLVSLLFVAREQSREASPSTRRIFGKEETCVPDCNVSLSHVSRFVTMTYLDDVFAQFAYARSMSTAATGLYSELGTPPVRTHIRRIGILFV